MLKLIQELYSLLTKKQRKRFYTLQVLMVLMAFSEVAGVAAIGIYMALIGDIDVVNGDGIFGYVYSLSGISEPYDFVFYVGCLVLIFLFVTATISVVTVWFQSRFAAKVGSEIGDRLYEYYINRPWLYHVSTSSSYLIKQVSTEANRMSNSIITPLMQMNSKAIVAIVLSVAIFIFNPLVALAGILIFSFAYIIIYKLLKLQLLKNGKLISEAATLRYKAMSEGFGGVKDVLLLGRSHEFVRQFKNTGKDLAFSQSNNQALSQMPRYFIELIAFGSVIFLILYLIKEYEGSLSAVLPYLAVYALTGFKLLPALQHMYSSIAQIKGNMSAFDSIKEDLINSQIHNTENTISEDGNNSNSNEIQKLKLKKEISLKEIEFTYPENLTPAIKNIDITIPVNKVVGIVGESGSGKSTLIDILLGLIAPDKGGLYIDGEIVDKENIRRWQDTLGFVPQSIFLSDGSISENVAFGIPIDEIDQSRVENALKMAHLYDYINTLDEGFNSRVGERGVKLSGGQRQRIGIARSLYHDASVLVFDEATSALDGITEKMVMEAIHDFSGNKTIIIIAHRLSTIKNCDMIYFIDEGVIRNKGKYDELIKLDAKFQKMAEHI